MRNRMMIFTLNDCEIGQLRGFMLDHKDCSDSPEDQYNYTFFPYGTGMLKTVTCSCGECITLEDYEYCDDDDTN